MHRFIPIYATWHGARVTEMPGDTITRASTGESKYGLERILKVVLDLIVVQVPAPLRHEADLRLRRLRLLEPVSSACSTGSIAVYWRLVGTAYLIQTPLPLLSVMTFITGVMCILMGLLAELIIRTYYESQGKMVYLIGETRNL